MQHHPRILQQGRAFVAVKMLQFSAGMVITITNIIDVVVFYMCSVKTIASLLEAQHLVNWSILQYPLGGQKY